MDEPGPWTQPAACDCPVLQAEDETVLPKIVSFLEEQGRMKFLRPLYRAMFKSSCGKQLALDTFSRLRDGYHPIASKMLSSDLGVQASDE